MKKSILYIGNKLSKHGKTLTNIETLGLLFESEGHKVFYASSKKNKLLRLLDMMAKTIRHRRVDYVLIDTYSTVNFWYAFVISQLCRLMNVRYLPILHGGNLPVRLTKNPRLCRMIFKPAYRNIAPSDYLLEAFKDKGFAPVVHIPNTIEIGKYAFKPRPVIRPKLLWVRSLAAIYNPEMALKVLQDLKNDFPDAVLCMVGPDKGHKRKSLQQMAESLQSEVEFTGKLSKKGWINRAADYDIFINTTHFDNMPVSVVEAMALGLPVVSTNVGGLIFLLKHQETALLVNDNDAVAMADAIRELIKNPEATQQMISNAAAFVQNFDWAAVRYKWDEILK